MIGIKLGATGEPNRFFNVADAPIAIILCLELVRFLSIGTAPNSQSVDWSLGQRALRFQSVAQALLTTVIDGDFNWSNSSAIVLCFLNTSLYSSLITRKELIFRRIPPPFSTIVIDLSFALYVRVDIRKVRAPSTLQKSALFGWQWAVRFHSADSIDFSVDSLVASRPAFDWNFFFYVLID